MDKLYLGLTTVLLIVAIYLIIIDNYLSSLAFFSLGILYVFIGWQEKANQPKIALFWESRRGVLEEDDRIPKSIWGKIQIIL